MQSQVRGSLCLPSGSERIIDADEEIFLIYTNLQSSTHQNDGYSNSFRGLGHVDSRKDFLDLQFELKGRADPPSDVARRGRKSRSRTKPTQHQDVTLEISLHQDKTALRSRKGDTGSVVWKASIDFAQRILQQQHSKSPNSLFNFETLRTQHVLELGAGTGLLSIALSPLVRRYTATDIEDLIPLIQKNITHNFDGWPNLPPGSSGSNVSIESLDWQVLESSSVSQRNKLFVFDPIDLILVVDSIYHPSLLPPLLSTIDHLAIPNKTAVLVISELRSEDVLREFLASWLARPQWEIWHISGDVLGDLHYVAWLGWRLPGES